MSSMINDLPEVSGGTDQDGRDVSPEGVHREPIRVHDVDAGETPGGMATQHDEQVDTAAIEYLDGCVCMGPRTLADTARAGGYAQPGAQSYPESGPRVMTGTRGSSDIGGIPGYDPNPGHRNEDEHD